MPRKTTSKVSANSITGFTHRSVSEKVTAFVYFDLEAEDFVLYGLTECSRNYQLLCKHLAGFFLEDEEVDARLRSGFEAICVDLELYNGRIAKTTVVIKHIPPELLQKFKENIEKFCLNQLKERIKTIEVENQ